MNTKRTFLRGRPAPRPQTPSVRDVCLVLWFLHTFLAIERLWNMSESQKGYREDLLVPGQAIVPLLVCPICLDVMRKVVLITCCGHSFCASCIKDQPCPHGCQLVPTQVQTSNIVLKAVIEALVTKCSTLPEPGNDTESPTCTWQGNIGELEQHLQECPFVRLPCPFKDEFGCDCPLVRRELWTTHQGSMSTKHAQLAITAKKQSSQPHRDLQQGASEGTSMATSNTLPSSLAARPPFHKRAGHAATAKSARASPRLQQKTHTFVARRERGFFCWECTAANCGKLHSTLQMPMDNTCCSNCFLSFKNHGVFRSPPYL
jgi:hypothetical protein